MSTSTEPSMTPSVIAEILREFLLDPHIHAAAGGQRLDVLGISPQGSRLGVLMKSWESPTAEMVEKATREAELLVESGGVDHGFIIIPTLPDDQQSATVCNAQGFRELVKQWAEAQPDFGLRGGFSTEIPTPPTGGKYVFVAMPFSSSYEDTYYLGILPTVEKHSGVCVRVDQQYFGGHILQSIYAEIERADLIIADVSDGNPNVTYELGYAHALKKPTVHLSSTLAEKLPFDIRQWPTVHYQSGQIHRLKTQLDLLLRDLMGKLGKAG